MFVFLVSFARLLSPDHNYYAFKVLGAAMIYAKVGEAAMVYTGDYNMTPDRHLGAAQIDRLNLDLVITEYGMFVFVSGLILFYFFVFM